LLADGSARAFLASGLGGLAGNDSSYHESALGKRTQC
jgi:hypothetical protein